MNVKPNELAELQQILNDFKIERDKIQVERDLPYLYFELTPNERLMLDKFIQKADRLYLELYLIIEHLKSKEQED